MSKTMESVQETPKLLKSDENSQNIDFNDTNWNCVTSQSFLKCYIQYLLTIEKEKEPNIVATAQEGKRPLTDPSTSSDAKRLKLGCENVSTGDFQLSTVIKTNDWHKNLCKCFKCLKMYEDYNIEFLFGIKTIEWLPTEILLIIFTQLLPSDRRVVSVCCKRFLEIWLSDDFNDDRRVMFDECVMDPALEPLSIFLRSPRNYQHLVISDVTKRGESVFAGKFGETVTNIELMHSNENSSFLSQFPNLKTIKVENPFQLGDYSNVPITIELLVVSCIDRINGDELNMLKRYIDKTSDLFRIELIGNFATKRILNFTEAQRNKIQNVHLKLEANDKTFKLPRFGNLKCLGLVYDYNCDYGTEEIPDNLKEQFPALENLSIEISYRLPDKNWTFLKKLIALKIPMKELSRLSIFENLEELTIHTSAKCFFVHEAFLNKNLKTLEIYPAKDPCVTCFKTMTKSFPNLENLTYNFRFTNDHLEELATNAPKLKCLKLVSVDPSVSFTCLPNLSELMLNSSFSVKPKTIKTFPLMLNLRKLELKLQRFDVETVTMFEKMPALEDLRLSCDDIDDNPLSLFDTMSKSLKRLKKFWFHCYKEPELKYEIYFEIVDMMAKKCKYLRHIRVCDFYIAMLV